MKPRLISAVQNSISPSEQQPHAGLATVVCSDCHGTARPHAFLFSLGLHFLLHYRLFIPRFEDASDVSADDESQQS